MNSWWRRADRSSSPPIFRKGIAPFNDGQGRGLHGRAVDMSDLVSHVEDFTGRPLIDRTGIKGLYPIETKAWLPPGLKES
ncbi:MAG TPA: DUF3738 domain-containing protein [Bryobacteraceae bacterium]|nr:DUF3738 domain-containing protein [Bryobacteraceae bacterium]